MFELNDLVEGVVHEIHEYGAWIKITPDHLGLLHKDDTPSVIPYKQLSVGDHIVCRILTVDLERHRIALTTKGD